MAKGASSSKVALSPQMKTAWRLYEAGDVVGARREATQVLARSPSPTDASQARDLIDRTGVPTSALYFALFALALVALMIVLAVARS